MSRTRQGRSHRNGRLARTQQTKWKLQPNGTYIINKKLQGRGRRFWLGLRDHGRKEISKISVQEIQQEAETIRTTRFSESIRYHIDSTICKGSNDCAKCINTYITIYQRRKLPCHGHNTNWIDQAIRKKVHTTTEHNQNLRTDMRTVLPIPPKRIERQPRIHCTCTHIWLPVVINEY